MNARARPLRAIVAKDVQLELRSGEALPGGALFAVCAIVVFHFALQRDTLEGALAAGVFWLSLLFAAFLVIVRLFVADAEEGGIDALRLAGIDGGTLVAAKATSLFAALALITGCALPAFALFLLGPPLLPALPWLVVVGVLVNGGLAAVGALTAALALLSRLRELIVPMLLLPLAVPLVIGAVEATTPLFVRPVGAPELRWLLLLGLYDLLFVTIAVGVADHLLEE